MSGTAKRQDFTRTNWLTTICSVMGFTLIALPILFYPIRNSRAAIIGTGDVSPESPASWLSSTEGYIGYSSSGTVTVDGQSHFLSACGFIGYQAGSSGKVSLTGSGTTWANSVMIYVGKYGHGELNIADGAIVTSSFGSGIAFMAGSTGTATVTGAGSRWSNSHNFYVGFEGNGTLNIEAGGQVNSTTVYLGYDPGSSGVATVTGAGSKWINSESLFVGKSGHGALTVTDGGTVTVGMTLYAPLRDIVGNGTITAKGAVIDADLVFDSTHGLQQTVAFGSGGTLELSLESGNDLGVGYQGQGTLRIAEGMAVTSANGYLGHRPGSMGTATVTGTGSKWTTGASLFVGLAGDGSLTVSDGGTVTAKTIYSSLSDLSGNGVITTQGAVLDADLVFDASFGSQQSLSFGTGGMLNLSIDGTVSLGVGYKETGTLRIADGVTVTSNSGYLGYLAGSTGTATVTGTGSTWSSNYPFIVGKAGHGNLTIEAGGKVACTSNAQVGTDAGSTGTVTVTGNESSWTNNGSLTIGQLGSGSLNIEAGGQVTCASGVIGSSANSSGTVTVAGIGSKWTCSSNLSVGSSGSGSLTVTEGGTVEVTKSLYASLSNLSGNGIITARGAVLDAELVFDGTHGSSQTFAFGNGGTLQVTLSSGNDLGAGYHGNGSLRIADGKLVNSSSGYLGYASGSTGSATVTGTGSKWSNSSSLYIGRAGNGSLTIDAAGQVNNTAGHLGGDIGATGTVLVTGSGSKWTNSNVLYVGENGEGTMRIESGGKVSNTTAYLGYNAGSTASAIVIGAGSTWTNSGSLYVGYGGSGTLSVSDGGTVTVAETLYASLSDLSGNGTITAKNAVVDADLVFDSTHGAQQTISFGSGGTLIFSISSSNDLVVGYYESGTLRVAEGVTATSTAGYLGNYAGSTGTATITGTGSKWINSGNLYVGNAGKGILNVEAGGEVNNAIGYLGYSHGSAGEATIAGAGAKWTNTKELYVGRSTSGKLNVLAGAQVANTIGYLGYNAGSSGIATVSGNGSTWTNSGSLYVGYADSGTLNIEDGGQVISASGSLAGVSGSSGLVRVAGPGSKWIMSGSLGIGSRGSGILNIESGGVVTSSSGGVGSSMFLDDAAGSVTVAGIGSKWINQSNLTIMYGTLRVQSGGQVINAYGVIGDQSTRNRTCMVTVTGNGSLWTNSNLFLGKNGKCIMDIEEGGQVDTANMCYLGDMATSSAEVNVTGNNATWNIGSQLYIGNYGSGKLSIAGGGQVNSRGSFLSNQLGSLGSVTISGAGSKWNNSGILAIGARGSATLRVESGGTVSSMDRCDIFSPSDSLSTVTVTGAGSTWTHNGELRVTRNGLLTIEAGGQVNTAAGYIGFPNAMSGIVTVTGNGSTWTNSGSLSVGWHGSGTVKIENGGRVSHNNPGYIGDGGGYTGAVNISGPDSRWITSSTLFIGNYGNGTLNIGSENEAGGLLIAYDLKFAPQSGGIGNCFINKSGTLQAGTITKGSGTANFDWNDGTIRNYNESTDLSIASGLVLKLAATGTHAFKIDAGRTGTINAILSDATSGGTLAKQGEGLLTLTAANTYSGQTTVEAGRFKVTGSILATSGIDVTAGATFELAKTAGSATAASLVIANQGTFLISAGTQTVGTISGTGITQADPGAMLTAKSIVQDSLFIGTSGAGAAGMGEGSGVNQVPEPGTVALMLGWVVGVLIAIWQWRRRA